MRIGWTSLDDNCHCPSPSYPLTMNFANRRVSSVDVSGRAQKVVGVHLGQPEGTAVDVVATPQQLLHLFIYYFTGNLIVILLVITNLLYYGSTRWFLSPYTLTRRHDRNNVVYLLLLSLWNIYLYTIIYNYILYAIYNYVYNDVRIASARSCSERWAFFWCTYRLTRADSWREPIMAIYVV